MNGAGFHNAGLWFRFRAGGNGFTRVRTKRAVLILTHLVVSAGRALPSGSRNLGGGKSRLGLLLLDFQIQYDLLATIKARNRTRSGFGAFFFRMQFIIGVQVQAAESITAGVIRVTAADRISP